MTPDATGGDPGILEWEGLADWWIDEGSRDPLYAEEVLPWLAALIPDIDGPVLDVGCGEGQAMRSLHPARVVGCDASMALLGAARPAGPVVRCALPGLRWLRDDAVAGAFAVFVLEHVSDVAGMLSELARVVAPDGWLVVIGNHPAYTAPGAGPVVDERDGEVLWRWGPYFTAAVAAERVGPASATFHHRPMSELLTAAADAGWWLERLDERGLSERAVARSPSLAGQEQLPRMLGGRWRLRP